MATPVSQQLAARQQPPKSVTLTELVASVSAALEKIKSDGVAIGSAAGFTAQAQLSSVLSLLNAEIKNAETTAKIETTRKELEANEAQRKKLQGVTTV